MALTMRARGGPGHDPSFRLPQRDVVIGRSPQADWVLPDPAQQLSANHALVQPGGDGHYLTDTSTNGTIVNGVRLTGRHRLRVGDVLRIGSYEIVIEDAAPPRPAGMDLNDWSAPAPAGAVRHQTSSPTASPSTAAPVGSDAGRLTPDALAHGLATLMATRARQRRELGVSGPDPVGTNPLARDPDQAARALAESGAPAEAVQAAVSAIEVHHATVLQAVQEAFRALHSRFAPDAIARNAGSLPAGEAREAALWRAHVAAFDGDKQAGFVEQFAQAFRQAYEQRAGRS